MSAYYIERNNMSGNGGTDQSQNGGAPGQKMNSGTPSGSAPGMQGNSMQNGAQSNSSNGMQTNGMQSGMNGQNSSPNGSPNGGSNVAANGAAQNGLGSQQNAGVRDYRDDLRELLDRAHAERGLTRYRLCKQMGIDSGTLSNVLAKRRHFSLEKLEQILGLLGYRLSFTMADGGANGAMMAGGTATRAM